MKAVIQRVKEASIRVDGKEVSRIDRGILTLLGIGRGDDESKLRKMIQKIAQLRIFPDSEGKMNLSLLDIRGAHLIVSQFTLLGECSQGRRPSFIGAEKPELALDLYEKALTISRETGLETAGGVFQADMQVSLVNDGPVTFVIEL
jgi:D-tyrosyl-tRNA(Tyr) deacylase